MNCGCGEPIDPSIKANHCAHCGISRILIDNKYQLLKKLGDGNFGEVYLCERPSSETQWAVKIFKPQVELSPHEQEEMSKRFLTEAQKTAQLGSRCPHIVRVIDSGKDAYHGLFYVMEYLQGIPLRSYLSGHEKEGIGLRKTLELTEQICQALQTAHADGVIHRDLKPENIFLAWKDGEHYVKLLDFGLAKVPNHSSGSQSSTRFATLVCAAPEQFNFQSITERTDLYALATIVYEMLTGERPFCEYEDETGILLGKAVNELPPPSMLSLRPSMALPQGVDQIVAKALAKDPDRRHTSAQEFWAELQSYYQAPTYVGGILAQQLRQEKQNLEANVTTLNETLTNERETTKQEKEHLLNQLSAKERELTQQKEQFQGQLSAKEHELTEQTQQTKTISEKLQQTEGNLKQIQAQLQRTEEELRKLREQPTSVLPPPPRSNKPTPGLPPLQQPVSVVSPPRVNHPRPPFLPPAKKNRLPPPLPSFPPKPPVLPIPEEPEPLPPIRKPWLRIATSCLLLISLAWGGIALMKPPPCYRDKTDSQPRITLASHAKTDGGRQFIEQSKGLRCTKLVRVPKGSFLMGSPNSDTEADGEEKPQHRVTLTRDFVMGKTEVTQQEFEDVMGYNPSNHKNCPTCPVENVTWHEAVAFTQKLSLKIGLISSEDEGCFTCTGTGKDITCSLRDLYKNKKYYTCPWFRLPTEAEWEYAARGGSSAPRYGKLDDIAWYSGNSDNKTHPVCTRTTTPHPYGLCDILGNVSEWTGDWYKEYLLNIKQFPRVDPVGPDIGSWRVLRGGSYNIDVLFVRAAVRFYGVPSWRGGNLGFRIVRSLSE